MTRKNNHIRIRRGFMCMLAFLFAFIFFSGSAVYAQQTQVTAILPATQKFTVKNAQNHEADEKCSYELIPFEADSPMPEGSESGKYDFTMDGNAQQKLSVTYAHGGVYQYYLRQTTQEADRYQYDRRVYTISVYVENGKNGELTTQVIAENEQKEKCENIIFENSYTGKDSSGAETQGNQSSTENHGSVKTGDHTPLAVWTALILLSAAGIGALFILKRRDMSRIK